VAIFVVATAAGRRVFPARLNAGGGTLGGRTIVVARFTVRTLAA
jgi:hypothetical protein